MLRPIYNVNINGMSTIRSTAVSVTANDVRFDFSAHRNVGAPYRGLLIVDLAQAIPTGTTATLPIVFTTASGNPINVTTFNGENVTVAELPGTGVYLFWLESTSGTLQLLTGSLS